MMRTDGSTRERKTVANTVVDIRDPTVANNFFRAAAEVLDELKLKFQNEFDKGTLRPSADLRPASSQSMPWHGASRTLIVPSDSLFQPST